ncbi:MAG: hypothetical protein ACETWE_04995 [Candidatus Bathyarchaeia archaeon]
MKRRKRRAEKLTDEQEKQIEQLVTFLYEEDALGYSLIVEISQNERKKA